MNNTQSGRTEDKAKKRARYLIGKTVVFGGVTFLSASTLVVTAIGMLCLIGFGVTLAADLEAAGALAIVTAGTFASAVYIGRISVREIKDSRCIARVPPVREQIATLPAEEVLVRGSDQPAASSDELLRAAHPSTCVPAEELLRAESRRK